MPATYPRTIAFASRLGPRTGSRNSLSATRRLRMSVNSVSVWRLVANRVTWSENRASGPR